MYLDDLANFTCEGAAFSKNYAGDQGGGIYAKTTAFVNNSCDVIGNQAPQGAALYIASVTSLTLENHVITDNVAFSGGVVYMTSSSVVASRVNFTSGLGVQEDSSNRAVESDRKSTVAFKECVFDGWLGDTVIYHKNAKSDSLSLDSCDFTRSSPKTAVSSLHSDAKIRNAVVGDLTLANGGTLNDSLPLVNRALNCSSPNICELGDCVDSTLGYLCVCLDASTCLNDGGEVFLDVEKLPDNETYWPDAVSFELLVSSASNGTTYGIWDLAYEARDLNLDVSPSSGILPPGGHITVVVTGTVEAQGIGGDLTSSFTLTSVDDTRSSSNARVELEVNSTFYHCRAHTFAVPQQNNTLNCEPCISVGDGEGVNCDSPGATLTSLPIRQGYWRSGLDSRVVRKCGHSGACKGATHVLSADDYCSNGHEGPCESTDGRYSALAGPSL